MATYKAPLEDMQFVLHELLEIEKLAELPGFEDVSTDLVDHVLEEGAKICEEMLFPLNRTGDEEGCQFENGNVRLPAGFRDAYRTFVEGGWNAVSCDPDYGGQGLPETLNVMFQEMLSATNISFAMYPGLTHGAYGAVRAHGDEALKRTFLPKMVEGTWSGTMCLTEPHCGTDLALVRTRAEPLEDGRWTITGTKIFISAGEHDLTENICHLVLARAPEAPAGIRGISLFLVPKFLPDGNGEVGERNAVHCGSIEHKMGIKASSTCVMNFDGATGYLVGGLHKGMRNMFTMMNGARLYVGLQGLGLSAAAYHGAVDYARERLQGRSLTGPKHPDKPADPIIVHPDVRRMLLTIRAYTEGMRALSGWVAREADIAIRHPETERRLEAEDFIALTTPVVKALFTDLGFENANLGVQVFGGHGYIRENGMEQYVRDARIAQIYEGTNGIQALDLVGRKMGMHTGRYLRRFFHPAQALIDGHQSDPEMQEFVVPFAKAFGRLQRATGWIAQQGLGNPDEAGAAATDYLRLFGMVLLGYMWLQMVDRARGRLEDDPTGFYRAKLDTARFFMQRLMPQTGAQFSAIMAGGGSITEFREAAF